MAGERIVEAGDDKQMKTVAYVGNDAAYPWEEDDEVKEYSLLTGRSKIRGLAGQREERAYYCDGLQR